MKDKKKLFMIVSICALIITIIASSITYAWYTWSTSESEETRIVTSMGSARVFYNGGADISNAVLKPTNDRIKDGIVKDITVKTDKDTTYKISFNLYLDVISIDEGLKDVSFRYALYKEGQTDAVKEGNFSQSHLDSNLVNCVTNSTNHIVLVSDEAVTTTTQKYTLYIWIDGENYVNPSGMQGKSFNFKLHADGENAVRGETIVEHINNLYNNSSKTVVTNNEIDYNYATSVSLMNDRLGTNNVGVDLGNIRYYGSNPNNYIDIGDVTQTDIKNWVEPMLNIDVPEAYIPTTEEDCSVFMTCTSLVSLGLFDDMDTCNTELPMLIQSFGYNTIEEACSITPAGTPKLYRIIGLFKDVELSSGQKKDLIKIVKDKPIRNNSWDQSAGNVNLGYGVNEWSQADLMKLLNPTYDNEEVGGSLYWNSASGSCYGYDSSSETYTAIPCDFTNSGLSEEARNKIETVKWNLGGHNDSNVFSNQIYEYEREDNLVVSGVTCSGDWCNDKVERTSIWEGKVALAYPSDYGYAVDFNNCSETLINYNNCIGDNWVYSTLTSNGAYTSWLITPDSSAPGRAWGVGSVGFVGYNYSAVNRGVSAVFYLDSALGISTGNGSETNPYVVR